MNNHLGMFTLRGGVVICNLSWVWLEKFITIKQKI